MYWHVYYMDMHHIHVYVSYTFMYTYTCYTHVPLHMLIIILVHIRTLHTPLCIRVLVIHTHTRTHVYSLYTYSLSPQVDPVDIPKYFSSTADIIRLADHTACDAVLVQKLVLKLQIVPLTKQLTNLSGVCTVIYGIAYLYIRAYM